MNRTAARRVLIALAIAPFTCASFAFADAPTTRASDTPNLSHARHTHPNNPPRPTTAPTADRFFTSRNSPIVHPLPIEDDSFSFIVFGDRTGGPAEGVDVLADAVRDANLIEPDLVMTIGDLVQGYNEKDEWEAQAREYKAIMAKLTCPWFPVAGNHDVYWRDKDGSGDKRPEGENQNLFEQHFGPLWYAFEHKNSWFITLYTDEGNPETGVKAFNTPDAQRMSDVQFNWLKETLAKAKNADHIFVFQHHPRWLGTRGTHEGYGDDWERIHKLFVEAGNVSAVFGGHIHNMRSDPRDGIQYQTLATVGGGNSLLVPDAGYIHHYNVVTVRKNQIGVASYPVGAAMDVREITGKLNAQSAAVARAQPQFLAPLSFSGETQTLKVRLRNPTTRPVTYAVSAESPDSRWTLPAKPQRVDVAGGATTDVELPVSRLNGAIDESTRLVELLIEAELPEASRNYRVPARRVPVPLDLATLPATSTPMMLKLDGIEAPVASAASVTLPGQTFTLEGRFRANRFKQRNGLLSKMQTSGYGIFVSEGVPTAAVFLDDRYLSVKPARDVKLETNRWYHIAQVFDGNELRLYLDGKLLAKQSRAGKIVDNDRPLVLGGDVDGKNAAEDTLDGELRDVRLSSVARYTGEQFNPADTLDVDASTLLSLPMDRTFGPWLVDRSPRHSFISLPSGAKIVPVDAKTE